MPERLRHSRDSASAQSSTARDPSGGTRNDPQAGVVNAAQDSDLDGDADRPVGEDPLQVVDTRNRLSGERHDNVVLLQASGFRRTPRLHGEHAYTVLHVDAGAASGRARNRNGSCPPIPTTPRCTRPSLISRPATKAATWIGIAKQMPCAGRIIAVLMPTTSPRVVDQRAAGVAGIQGRVGLDDVSIRRPDARAACARARSRPRP